MRYILIACAVLALGISACSKPLVSAKVSDDIAYMGRDYAATPNEAYYAIRGALAFYGYPISQENLQDGVITTTWSPVKSDSHYIDLFDRPDYGVTNSYHQLEVQVIPQGGRTEVKVGSRIKTLVASVRSSGREERNILSYIGDYLRKTEPEVTNLGVQE